jgi:hypothetical protein
MQQDGYKAKPILILQSGSKCTYATNNNRSNIMNEYEVIINLRKNGIYDDGTLPARFVLSAQNTKQAKELGWEVYISATNSIMKREMCKVDANRI